MSESSASVSVRSALDVAFVREPKWRNVDALTDNWHELKEGDKIAVRVREDPFRDGKLRVQKYVRWTVLHATARTVILRNVEGTLKYCRHPADEMKVDRCMDENGTLYAAKSVDDASTTFKSASVNDESHTIVYHSWCYEKEFEAFEKAWERAERMMQSPAKSKKRGGDAGDAGDGERASREGDRCCVIF